MSENLTAKNPIYPLFGVLTTLILFFGGMALAEDPNCLWLLLGAFGLFLVFGYWRACIAIIPFTAIMALVFCGVTWAATKDPEQTRYAFNRILALCVAIIPGLGMPVEDLTRNLTALHFPRMLVLGMMITFSFFPMLRDEVRRIREAMRTRGAGNPLRPAVFYRAFLIPLIMRLVNISDTLSLSVETRGFDRESECSVYHPIRIKARDIIFLVLLAAGIGTAVIL